MIKTPSKLQDLRRKLYAKAKADTAWRFGGLYVHVCKRETLHEAYWLAKKNNGAPGTDGVPFEAIEASGVEAFRKQIQDERAAHRYRPLRNRRQEIPKGDGKVRVLGIPAIRDRVAQGALKLIREPIFEADSQPGSFGYRPGRTAPEAVQRVAAAIVKHTTRVLDSGRRAYFDNGRQDLLVAKVARRVRAGEVLHWLKRMLQASGATGVPQGGGISPWLSNRYLNAVDPMRERAKETTRNGKYTDIGYARSAEDRVIRVDAYPRQDWLLQAADKRRREELAKLQVAINAEESRVVDLGSGESFGLLGFDSRRVRRRQGVWRPCYTPERKKRTALREKLRDIFRRLQSQPVGRVVALLQPILRGWVRYCAVGDASRCFGFVKGGVEKKVRRPLRRARGLRGFGWARWRRRWLEDQLGLCNGYRVSRPPKAQPTG